MASDRAVEDGLPLFQHVESPDHAQGDLIVLYTSCIVVW